MGEQLTNTLTSLSTRKWNTHDIGLQLIHRHANWRCRSVNSIVIPLGQLVEIKVSDDIRAVIDWEIANNENSVENVYYPQGLPVVAMKRPVKQWLRGVLRDVPPTLAWWEFRDAHYGEEEWCAGFESSESGHKVCGPLR